MYVGWNAPESSAIAPTDYRALPPEALPGLRHIRGLRIPAIPRTLTGKKLELQIKKLLLGQSLEKVVNPDTLANPEYLAW